MVDSTVKTLGLRTHFSSKAVLPEKELREAMAFLDQLQGLVKKYEVSSKQERPVRERNTQRLADLKEETALHLRTLQQRTDIYMFNAAVLAGMDSSSEGGLDKKVAKISEDIKLAEKTCQSLYHALKRFEK